MAKRTCCINLDEPDQGWRSRHKRNELKFESNNVKVSHPMNLSSTIVTADNRIGDYGTGGPTGAVTARRPTLSAGDGVSSGRCEDDGHATFAQDTADSSDASSSCLKYLHKKFKRVASAVIDDCSDNKIGRLTNLSNTSNSPIIAHTTEPLLTAGNLHITRHGQDDSGNSRSSSSINCNSSSAGGKRTETKSGSVHETVHCQRCAKPLATITPVEQRHWPHLCDGCIVTNVPKELRNRSDAPVLLTKKCDSGADTKCDELQYRCHDILDEVKLVSRVVTNNTSQRNKVFNRKPDFNEYGALEPGRNSVPTNSGRNCENCGGTSGRAHCSVCQQHGSGSSSSSSTSGKTTASSQRGSRTLAPLLTKQQLAHDRFVMR